MKGIETKILLVLILVALLANAYLTFVGSTERQGTLANPAPAQAKVTTDKYFLLYEDSYIITTDTSGQNIYLYYFERGPKKEDSKLFYLKKIRAQ